MVFIMVHQVVAALCCVVLFAVCGAEAQRESCCYGKTYVRHGEIVLNLDRCCVSLMCNDGDIETVTFGKPGDCNEQGCLFDGRLHPNGSSLPAHCAALTCVNGKWQRTRGIEDCCEHCYLFNTHHVFTFDNNYYNWDGPCNYSVAQTGLSHYPEVAVYSSFQSCFSLGSPPYCLYYTTFRNDPHTVITLRHVSGNSIFNIMVNGHLSVVGNEVQEVESAGGQTHPVLAWRYLDCLFLLGSSGLMIQHCPHRLDVWAFPTLAGSLHGLCGHFNFYPSDDMTARDGTVHPIHPHPLAFPESWRTAEQSTYVCKQPCRHCNNPTKSDSCVASAAKLREYHVRCGQRLHLVLGPDTELQHHVDACERDLCLMDQAGVSEADQQDWLIEMIKITQISKILLARAKGKFVPEPLFAPLQGLCVPGSFWTHDCNGCKCTNTAIPACTLKACSEDHVPELGEEYCKNGSRWRNGECSVCVCINSGQVCSFDDECLTTFSPTVPSVSSTSPSPPFFVCAMPRRPGTCGQQILRWYYNFESGRCSQFYYTGCDGNQNNFETLGECEAMCGFFTTSRTVTPITRVPLSCYMRWDAGTCREGILKYHYAKDSGVCIPAYYSGCGGNDNRFDSFEDCMRVCGGSGSTTEASTIITASTCPSVMLSCPQDCGVTFIIDPDTNCPKCVCDFSYSYNNPFTTQTQTAYQCPAELSICPTYCPVVTVRDPATGCSMCTCRLPVPPAA